MLSLSCTMASMRLAPATCPHVDTLWSQPRAARTDGWMGPFTRSSPGASHHLLPFLQCLFLLPELLPPHLEVFI